MYTHVHGARLCIYLQTKIHVPYYLANMPPFFANQHRLQV